MTKPTTAELKKMTKSDLIEVIEDQEFNDFMDKNDVVFPEPKNVHEALNQLMGRVGYVQKESKGELPYTFASEPAFIRAVRPHMVDLGLIIYQTDVEKLYIESYTSKKGSIAFARIFKFWFTITHTPTETHQVVTAIGEGTDYGDKASNKCMTVALKYVMRQSLLIETGDDPDQFNSDDFERAKEQERIERSLPRSSGGDQARIENQWEQEVIDDIMTTKFVESNELARPHIVNILNNSIFMTTVPYGELTREIALGYVLAWTTSKDKYPDDDTPARADRVNTNWEKIMEGFVEEAIEEIKGIEGDLFDSGLGYDGP